MFNNKRIEEFGVRTLWLLCCWLLGACLPPQRSRAEAHLPLMVVLVGVRCLPLRIPPFSSAGWRC